MICVEGIIIPANWDNNGNVLDYAVATSTEEEYLLVIEDPIARLKKLLRQKVTIEGILRTQKGRKVIHVEKFSQLKD